MRGDRQIGGNRIHDMKIYKESIKVKKKEKCPIAEHGGRHVPVIPALERQREVDFTEISLIYMVKSRPARTA